MILHHEFIRSAKKFGNRIAINDKMRGSEVTFSKALIATIMLANKFSKYNGGLIGIMIPSSAGASLSILGTVFAGKVPVMINYSTGAAENCEYAQQKCGLKTIITSRALLEKIGCRLVKGMVFLEDIMEQITIADKLSAALKSKLPAAMLIKSLPTVEEDDNVTILFTSGSEKDPKAVQLTHRNIGSNLVDINIHFKFTSDDIMLANLPFFHVFGLTVNHWLPLTKGMRMVTYANPLDYRRICEIIREEKCSIMVGTPIFLSGYVRKAQKGDFDSVRLIVAGADKVSDQLRASYSQKLGIELYEGYGATETSPVVSANTPEANKPGSIGKPLPTVQVKIVDHNTGEDLPIGQTGKILVKGDLVMKGYFDDLEETALHIRNGWYDTGDMGMIDADGFIYHKGRLKRFVKIGGEMVSLVRVEKVIESMLPEGVSCCVVEIPDSLKGAKIIAVTTEAVDSKKMLKQMAEELPALFLPKKFVVLDEIPRMGSGKVDFRTTTQMVKQMNN
ncbi:AMP-binding protein [bacterium]|nr:AMP-binding protein [bacterium]